MIIAFHPQKVFVVSFSLHQFGFKSCSCRPPRTFAKDDIATAFVP